MNHRDIMHTRWSSTQSDVYQMFILIKLILLMMDTWLPETCREWKQTYKKELYVKLVIYKDQTRMHGQQNIKRHKSL